MQLHTVEIVTDGEGECRGGNQHCSHRVV
jgi:hypothetical protein